MPEPITTPESTAQIPTESLQTVASSQQEVPNDAIRGDIKQLKDFFKKLKQGIQEKRALAKNASTNPVGNSTKNSLFANNKLLIIALVVFLFFAVLLIAASLYKSLAGTKAPHVDLASPTPNVSSINPQISTPSKYATDSAVVKMDADIHQLNSQMSESLKDSELTPPGLDFNVSF